MILVTGGTGFLGAYIIQNLVQKNIAVRAIRRSKKTPFFISDDVWQKVEWVDADVFDVVGLLEAMQGCTGVIHAAAVVSFSSADENNMRQVNIEGTKNVVNCAIEAGVKRFVHVSSVAAIGRTEKDEMVNEEKPWTENRSNTKYAVSKRGAELEAWRGFAEGLEGVIVNPSTILGFGNWHTSSCALFKNVYNGFPWYTDGVNGFVGVHDVAEATVQLLLSSITEKRFIVSAENWPFKKLFTTMANGFGKQPPAKKATPFLGELAWRLESAKDFFGGAKPLLTKESARVAHSKTTFDNSALLQALPQFSFSPLETVIKNSCEKYIEAVQKGLLSA